MPRFLWNLAELAVDTARKALDDRRKRIIAEEQARQATEAALHLSQELLKVQVARLNEEMERLKRKGLATWEASDDGG